MSRFFASVGQSIGVATSASILPLDLLDVQGTLKRLLQHHSSKASILRCSAFFMAQLSNRSQFSSVAQSCPTLRNPMDCSLPGSSIHGIFQARVLEWGAIAFSNDQLRQHIKKQRHYFANKGPSTEGHGFSSSHVWM